MSEENQTGFALAVGLGGAALVGLGLYALSRRDSNATAMVKEYGPLWAYETRRGTRESVQTTSKENVVKYLESRLRTPDPTAIQRHASAHDIPILTHDELRYLKMLADPDFVIPESWDPMIDSWLEQGLVSRDRDPDSPKDFNVNLTKCGRRATTTKAIEKAVKSTQLEFQYDMTSIREASPRDISRLGYDEWASTEEKGDMRAGIESLVHDRDGKTVLLRGDSRDFELVAQFPSAEAAGDFEIEVIDRGGYDTQQQGDQVSIIVAGGAHQHSPGRSLQRYAWNWERWGEQSEASFVSPEEAQAAITAMGRGTPRRPAVFLRKGEQISTTPAQYSNRARVPVDVRVVENP